MVSPPFGTNARFVDRLSLSTLTNIEELPPPGPPYSLTSLPVSLFFFEATLTVSATLFALFSLPKLIILGFAMHPFS